MSSWTIARRGTRLLTLTTGLALAAGLTAPAALAADGAVVSGTVRGVDGAPLRNVGVALVVSGTFGDVVARTGADGRYRVRVPAPLQQVQVQFTAAKATGGTSATGYADACYQGPAYCQDPGTGARTFDLPAGASKTVDVTLGRASVLGGRVVDALGRGVGGLKIYGFIDDIQPPVAAPADALAVTDVNGNWTFGRVDPLVWAVNLGAFELPAVVPATPAPYGYSATGVNRTVAAGRVVSLSTTLVGAGALAGRVVDQSGAPVAGATVSLPTSPADTGDLLQTTTDSRGRFEIDGVPAGTFPVCVDAANYDDPCRTDPDGNQVTVQNFTATTVKFVLHRTS